MRFRLPGSPMLLAPSAEVIWCRNAQPTLAPIEFQQNRSSAGELAGAGVRFLEMDGQSVRGLDDFVYERAVADLRGFSWQRD